MLLALTLAAGCGGGEQVEKGCATDVENATGVRLTYAAKGQASAGDLRATADKLCRRIEGVGKTRPAVAVNGDQVVVVVPAGTPKSLVDYIGTPGRLVFYDWEPVIFDDDCKTDPNVNANERQPRVGRKLADELAAKCGGDAIVVRQERSAPEQPKPDAWWIVRDKPVLEGEDIVNPQQDFDAMTNEPIVTIEFTPEGKRAFAEVTRAVARRGQDNTLPGLPAVQASHHFAIVLDDELLSTPFIDFEENPQGIDGENGAQISGGFTKDGALVLARLLALGPLPLELELVDRRDQR
jgi:preprotein translocase subunit SecD